MPIDCGSQPVATIPTNYDELPIGTEGSAIETFLWLPDYTIVTEEMFASVEKEFENGCRVSFPTQNRTRRRFEVNFLNRDETERDAIAEFIEARIGGEEAFYFTPEDETVAIKVCLDGDGISISKKNPDIYDLKAVFLEIY